MNIALFGAVFDPPHHGHLTIARELLNKKLADEVWMIPVGDHPLAKLMSSAVDRRAMLELVIEPGMKIDDYELEKSGRSYTIDTLRHHLATWPEHRFFWVIGSDNVGIFSQWKDYQTLLSDYEIWVYPRRGWPMDQLLPGMKPLTAMPEIDVSSTQVRDRVKNGQSISELVDPRVEKYIKQHHLYQ